MAAARHDGKKEEEEKETFQFEYADNFSMTRFIPMEKFPEPSAHPRIFSLTHNCGHGGVLMCWNTHIHIHDVLYMKEGKVKDYQWLLDAGLDRWSATGMREKVLRKLTVEEDGVTGVWVCMPRWEERGFYGGADSVFLEPKNALFTSFAVIQTNNPCEVWCWDCEPEKEEEYFFKTHLPSPIRNIQNFVGNGAWSDGAIVLKNNLCAWQWGPCCQKGDEIEWFNVEEIMRLQKRFKVDYQLELIVHRSYGMYEIKELKPVFARLKHACVSKARVNEFGEEHKRQYE